MQSSFDNALQVINQMRNTIDNLVLVMCVLFAIYCICSLVQEIKKLKRLIDNKEVFIFKSSVLTGVYFLFSIESIVIAICGFTATSFDIFLKLITISMGGVAFVIAFLNFQRKSGAELTYISSFNSSNYGNQFLIINLKDKSIVILDAVIKFKNISISLPFEYPVIIGGYSAISSDIKRIDKFYSYSNGGYFDVINYDKQERDYYCEENSMNLSGYSGQNILDILSSGNFDVYVLTNISDQCIQLKKQALGAIPKNSIHIDRITCFESSRYEKELEEEFYNICDDLSLSFKNDQYEVYPNKDR